MVTFLVLGLVVVVSTGWGAYSRLKAQARDAQVPRAAAAKGLEYAKDDPFDSKVLAFTLFQQGDGSRIENVIWNPADAADLAPGTSPPRVFDFGWYKTRHNRNGSTYEEWHWATCALAQADGSWPTLQIEHQHLWDKALDLMAGDPIHFESDEFNQTFRVTCKDRRFASALIDPQMMQFLLDTKGLVGFATMGRFVLAGGPQIAPDAMPILLGLVEEFVRRVPTSVWELYPRRAPLIVSAADAPGAGTDPTADAVPAGDAPDPDEAWDPTPGVDYDLDGHPVVTQTEDPWHDHPVRPHDPRPPDRIE